MNDGEVKYLSLFSGAGGGDLACQHLLGWKCVGYVEWEKYCQQILAARIKEGFLWRAPIFGDIRRFNTDWAGRYQGVVDVITAGFPCQPFSVAGKRAGADDDRNMWPATIECIRLVRPGHCLLENVSGLLASGYFGAILGDLAQSGYDARWRILSAAGLGASHRRDRVWIVAYAKGIRLQSTPQDKKLERHRLGEHNFAEVFREQIDWSSCGPGRKINGVACRVDRLKAIGNGQVPAVAAAAWRLLNGF